MRIPTLQDPVSALIRFGRYAVANVKADPEVASLAKVLLVAQQKLLERVGARNRADDAEIDQEALRDYRLRKMREAIKLLGIKAYGHFGSRDDDGYARLFPKAPSLIATQTADRDREAVFGSLVRAATARATPADLVPPAKALAEAWKTVQEEETALAARRESLEAAEAAEREAREAWVAAARRLAAQLTDRFPLDRERVDSYFPPATRGRGRRKETAAAPAAPA